MGEPAMPTASDRAITRCDAIQIVDSVTNDERMPLGIDVTPVHGAGEHFLRTDVENVAFRLAQEITLLADQLDFIGEMVLRVLRMKGIADPGTDSTALAQIYNAAREHSLPDWWPAFRDERNSRSKHG